MFNKEEYLKRVEWFTQARFGMFIHWGLYSIPSRGEWLRSDERILKEDYMHYFEEFNPQACNPAEWVRAAKQAGMQYVVLTAKHHDGFCLFDTQTTDFKSTNTPAGRDFVREFVDACHTEGIRAGLYFSIIDWYHNDFPHFSDMHHPMRGNPDYPDEGRDFDRYLDYMHLQVKELCSNYGKLDLLWFDFSYGPMRGEKWRATELMQMVRQLQPGILIDNRLEVSGEGFGSLADGNPTPYHGDFVSPEQIIPPNGLRDVNGDPLVWEACVTMNNHWGYFANDPFFKPAPMLLQKLVECVSKGGNLLLNIGPDANGCIPPASTDILNKIGAWINKNSKSIYGCGMSTLAKPEYGRITQNGKYLYFHVFQNSVGPLPLFGVPKDEIVSIRKLCDGTEVPLSTSWTHSDYPDIAFADLGPNPVLPDETDTVLEVRLR